MKKNICIIVSSLYGGGAERVAADLTQILYEKYNVYIVVFSEKEKQYDFRGKYINIGVPLRRGMGKILTVIQRVKKLKAIKRVYQIDISISILDSPNLVNILSGGKTIISYHSNKTVADKSRLARLINRQCIKKADKIVTVSNYIREDLIKNYGADREKLCVIHNMCDVNKIINLAKKDTPYKEKHPVLVTVGNLREAKGHWHLIKAFSEVKKDVLDAELYIIGEGELLSKLERLIGRLDLRESVHLEGFQENPFPYMKGADVFVFSSIYEGFGNVLVEALACEKAIVSVDCPAGPKEILNPTNINRNISDDFYEADFGILVPPFSTEYDFDENVQLNDEELLFAEAIKHVLNSPDIKEQYKNRALNRALDFSMKEAEKKWVQLIDSIA